MRSETSPVMGLLKDSGHEIVFAPGFEPAIRKLDQIAPDLLITDVRLGGFNGLHLVIRSQSSRPKMRSILLDRVHDPVVAVDAERQGAVYLGGPLNLSVISEQISKVLNESGPQRRWPRKQPIKGLVFHVARRSARVIDIVSLPVFLVVVLAHAATNLSQLPLWRHSVAFGHHAIERISEH